MYVATVLDPSSLAGDLYEDNESNLLNMIAFLKGVQDNGIMLFDDGGLLSEYLKRAFRELPQNVSSCLKERLIEIKKNNKHIKLSCEKDLISPSLGITEKYNPDILLIGNIENYKYKQTTSVSEYVFSKFETEIRSGRSKKSCAREIQFNDTTDEEIIKDAIRRCIQYSYILKIYDKQIGQNIEKEITNYKQNRSKRIPIEPFYQGIKYILDIWKEYAVIEDSKKLEIYTVHDDRGKFRQYDTLISLKTYLKDKLKNDFPEIEISIQVHEDRYGNYHARFLESKYAIVKFDRGFDLFYFKDGRLKFKHNEMDIKPLNHKTGYVGTKLGDI